MSLRYLSLASCSSVLLIGGLVGCSSTRQIAVDSPKTELTAIPLLKGQSSVTTDDYYVQLVSEFDLKGDSAIKGGCSEVGGGYDNNDLSAALVFDIRNDDLKLKRQSSGFLYQATTGRCNYKLETRKAYLTPWLRLDAAQATELEYQFLTSNSHEANLSKVVGDINAASGLLALTGVGTGIAIMGKVAETWMQYQPAAAAAAQPKPQNNAQYSSQTHSLPAQIVSNGDSMQLQHSRLPVYEVLEGRVKVMGPDTKLLGEVHVYPQTSPSLLIKQRSEGIPDAQDLSWDTLMRQPMHAANGDVPLQQWIAQLEQVDKPNLQPNWQNYEEVETQCRKLKSTLRDLGFNKFDRNAVLYYFLQQSRDWRNFNIGAQRALNDDIRAKNLEQFRNQGFGNCLVAEDYATMKAMHLPVNTMGDWDKLTDTRMRREGVINPVQSAARQLLAALNNPDRDQAARQLYPLLKSDQNGDGTVLLENHLSNFGLEALLQQQTAISDAGLTINAQQLAAVFAALNIEQFSCTRPAQDQGQPLPNIGMMLFLTKPGSPKDKGGALEFELAQGKIKRIAFQHPSYRDFEQNLADYPDLGGCRIETEFVNKLH